ncbi:hypothetical protein RM530_08245 [Algiphilus sp. W345]|uniref:Uncharacterized protein n=1 Tax=Banduia mediterranea TaxID=3075609 RepID=A0ABU2WI93_9GAMM|nr:hypothetical protein [Algiphilus sp. W345]MDT0497354.1 hypothetical protein [Algiphilus sp. W345]
MIYLEEAELRAPSLPLNDIHASKLSVQRGFLSVSERGTPSIQAYLFIWQKLLIARQAMLQPRQPPKILRSRMMVSALFSRMFTDFSGEFHCRAADCYSVPTWRAPWRQRPPDRFRPRSMIQSHRCPLPFAQAPVVSRSGL